MRSYSNYFQIQVTTCKNDINYVMTFILYFLGISTPVTAHVSIQQVRCALPMLFKTFYIIDVLSRTYVSAFFERFSLVLESQKQIFSLWPL